MTVYEKLMAVLTAVSVFAIAFSPLVAVQVTRRLDDRKQDRARKLAIFSSLMKTRAARLDPEHVAALNLIEVEFFGDNKVVSAYRKYIDHLSSPLPAVSEQERYFHQRHQLFLEVLYMIGHNLGFNFDKNDLNVFAYTPQGWGEDLEVQRNNSIMLGQLMRGERPLPVTQFLPSRENPFPPPPPQE